MNMTYPSLFIFKSAICMKGSEDPFLSQEMTELPLMMRRVNFALPQGITKSDALLLVTTKAIFGIFKVTSARTG